MTKSKSSCSSSEAERIYDSDGYWLRAACVCVKDAAEAEVLLVSSSAHPERWIVPGGKVQLKEAPEDSAAREAMEEAGAVGTLGRCLGVFDNDERKHRTRVYVLVVGELLDQYEDVGSRKRGWFRVDEAAAVLRTYKPLHCKYLAAMRATAADKTQNGQ